MIEVTIQEPETIWPSSDRVVTKYARNVELHEYNKHTHIGHDPYATGAPRYAFSAEPGANITMAAPGVLVFGSEAHRSNKAEGHTAREYEERKPRMLRELGVRAD